MPIASTRAFVLGGTPLNEQDRLIHLLTSEQGIIRAIAPGSLKARNRFGALFELFTEGEFHYYWKESREMITISRGEIIESYFNIVSLPANIFYFYLVADILLHFIPYSHKDSRLYRLVHTILEHRHQGIAMNMLLLYFLVWVLRIEGMMFNPNLCYNCYSTNFTEAWLKNDFRGILCPQCHSNEKHNLTLPELQFLKWTEKNKPKDLVQWYDRMDTAKMIRTFTNKIEFHGECLLKTARYLQEYC